MLPFLTLTVPSTYYTPSFTMPFSEVLTSDCHQTTLALLFIAISISLGIYMHLPHLLKILSPGSLLLSSDIIFGDLNISVNYSSDTLTSQFINLFSSTFSQLPTPILCHYQHLNTIHDLTFKDPILQSSPYLWYPNSRNIETPQNPQSFKSLTFSIFLTHSVF